MRLSEVSRDPGYSATSVEHHAVRYANSRAEVLHQPTRQRAGQMRGLKSPGHAQRFLSVLPPCLLVARVPSTSYLSPETRAQLEAVAHSRSLPVGQTLAPFDLPIRRVSDIVSASPAPREIQEGAFKVRRLFRSRTARLFGAMIVVASAASAACERATSLSLKQPLDSTPFEVLKYAAILLSALLGVTAALDKNKAREATGGQTDKPSTRARWIIGIILVASTIAGVTQAIETRLKHQAQVKEDAAYDSITSALSQTLDTAHAALLGIRVAQKRLETSAKAQAALLAFQESALTEILSQQRLRLVTSSPQLRLKATYAFADPAIDSFAMTVRAAVAAKLQEFRALGVDSVWTRRTYVRVNDTKRAFSWQLVRSTNRESQELFTFASLGDSGDTSRPYRRMFSVTGKHLRSADSRARAIESVTIHDLALWPEHQPKSGVAHVLMQPQAFEVTIRQGVRSREHEDCIDRQWVFAIAPSGNDKLGHAQYVPFAITLQFGDRVISEELRSDHVTVGAQETSQVLSLLDLVGRTLVVRPESSPYNQAVSRAFIIPNDGSNRSIGSSLDPEVVNEAGRTTYLFRLDWPDIGLTRAQMESVRGLKRHPFFATPSCGVNASFDPGVRGKNK